jgi:hypothetical protein
VIAFGTAASPEESCAGNVVIGSKVFVFDAEGSLGSTDFLRRSNEIVDSDVGSLLLRDCDLESAFEAAKKRFIRPPNRPSLHPSILLGSSYVSVGVVNVSRSEDYKTVDPIALSRFGSLKEENQLALSVETTHGLIRLCIDRPFLYVSGLTNQVGRFNEEVSPNKYSQNFAAAHNAAVCVAWMLPHLCANLLADGQSLERIL